MSNDIRREKRYPYPLPVTLTTGKVTDETRTRDVSFNGVFVFSELLVKLRQLVRLDVQLPWQEVSLTVHAMVVHLEESDTQPGVGLQFFGVGKSERETWNTFVNQVRQGVAERDLEAWDADIAPPRRDDERRDWGRFDTVLEVRLRTLDELVTLYTRDVSKGGMFLSTDLPLQPGADLLLEVVHPDTSQVHDLRAVVRRQVDGTGVGVEFVGLDQGARERFWGFVSDHLEWLGGEDLVLLE